MSREAHPRDTNDRRPFDRHRACEERCGRIIWGESEDGSRGEGAGIPNDLRERVIDDDDDSCGRAPWYGPAPPALLPANKNARSGQALHHLGLLNSKCGVDAAERKIAGVRRGATESLIWS
uniref:Uncharacterized protein n=1 Tax=Moniliophthora roreri TaxID=221103 RepID=A0A0W0FWQ3_MONRR